jgi:TP901 family phage tail tape measure protein
MSNALIGALRVVLGLDSAAFDEGLSLAEKKLARFGKSMGRLGDNLSSIGRDMSLFVTAPIAAFGAMTLKTAGDFEAAMNRVGAATGATGDVFDRLRQLAIDLGQDTSKSASESADMLEMLAKNGLSAEQILGGAADAAIRLSEATGGDLSRSADVATNVMAQFGLKASDLARVVDQITGVTLASQFGFDDYAQALGQAGGVAGALGVSLTEFNAAIAATSDVFNSGSDAGTSFKTFLTRLVPQSDAAAAAMQKLGLEFFDANGKMKSLPAIAQELKEALAGLSDEARNDALNTIFGQDALRTAIALGNEGAAGISAMVEQINREGIAGEQAAARMKGFNGEMEKLTGAFESLQIAIAGSGLLAMATELVSKLAEWITSLGQTNPELLKWGVIIAGVAAAIGPLLIGLGLVATAIAAIATPVGIAIAALAGIAAAIVYFKDDIAAFDQAVTAWAGNFDAAFISALSSAEARIIAFDHAVTAWARGFDAAFVETMASAKQGIISFDQAVMEWARNFDAAFVAGFNAAKAATVQFAAELPAIFADLAARMVEIGGQIIDGLWQGLKGKFASVKEGLTSFASGLAGSVRSTLGIQSPSTVMQEIGKNIMQGLGLGIAGEAAAVGGTVKGVTGELTATFQGLEASAAATGAKVEDAWAGLREVTSEAKDAGKSMDGLFSNLGSSIAGLIKGTKDWRDVLSDVLGQIAQMALSNLGNMGGIGGFLSSLLGGLTGFASGGTIMPGGTGGIDSQVVAFRKSPNERVDITKPGQRIGGGPGKLVINQTFPITGAISSEDVFRMVQQGAASAVAEVKNNLDGWQLQLGRDGSFA